MPTSSPAFFPAKHGPGRCGLLESVQPWAWPVATLRGVTSVLDYVGLGRACYSRLSGSDTLATGPP
jgi:hypothetical protein